MSYFGERNTFHPTVIRNFESEMEGLHQERVGYFASECMRTVNQTEDTIKREGQRINDRVERVLKELAAGLHISDPQLGQNNQALTEAIARRALAFDILTGALETEKIQELVNASTTIYNGQKR
jgi:hypothetical protein